MSKPERIRQKRRDRCLAAFVLSVSFATGFARSEDATPASTPTTDTARIERLEKLLSTVMEENLRLAGEVHDLKRQIETRVPDAKDTALKRTAEAQTEIRQELAQPSRFPAPPPFQVTPVETDSADDVADLDSGLWDPMDLPDSSDVPYFTDASSASTVTRTDRFRVDYENGFTIVPLDPDATPFSLRVRSQNVFRYNGFARTESFWTDSAGNRIPIANDNYFGIPRGRIIFSGTALLPELRYLLNIDYNSVTNNPIGFRAYVLSYRFSDAIELSIGQSKVPGSREWLESAFAPLQGPDRSMATTFFRPSLSQGIWITGEPLDGWYYHAMVSNGFNTLNLAPDRLNDRFCWSASTWWEPWGEFGAGYSDLQNHEDAAIRIGGSYTYAIGRGSQSESDAVENSPIRLSDGTLITTPGALAPGVTLQSYDISLGAIDLAYKYKGIGVSTELYWQDLLGLRGTGPLPIRSTGAFGGFVQGGYFVVPQQGELYARTSYVTGDYGAGYELGGGFNWFFRRGRENLRFTLDGAWLDGSPAGQNRTGYVAGQTGVLLRAQITAVY
ncbi:porin [bacterium]|nr:porin [bacterium]